MAEKNPFEITPELRALTLESVEPARTAYGRFMDYSHADPERFVDCDESVILRR